MIGITLKKILNILIKRPERLLKKDFYFRFLHCVKSATSFKKLPPSSKPRLYFDVTVFSLHDNKTGVQRVIRSMFEELKLLLHDQYEIIPVSCTAFTRGFQALSETKRRKFKLTGFNISPCKGDVFLSFEQAFVEHLAQEEAFKDMQKKGCRIILTVYDLLPLQLPYCFPSEVEGIFNRWLLSTSNFSEFLCDSKTVEIDLKNYLLSKNQRIKNSYWFYPGSNFVNNVSSTEINENQSLYLKGLARFKFNFLMVGTIEPRKGHKIILDLFTNLWKIKKENVSLTFIGKEGWMVKELTRNFKASEFFNKNFFWFNNASDYFLNNCYKEMDAVIVASLNEGYGLPLIEASQRNCRVIANDIPIFREVAPRGCYFLNLSNPIIALRQLQNWIMDPPDPCFCIKARTWQESAIQVIEKTNLI